jgi:hypothetical protein
MRMLRREKYFESETAATAVERVGEMRKKQGVIK